MQKENTESFINSKDAMTMLDINHLKGHTGGAIHGIFVTTSKAKAAVTAEGNKLKFPTVRTFVHGPAKGRIPTVDHLINIFHLTSPGMKSIFNFFIMVSKDSL